MQPDILLPLLLVFDTLNTFLRALVRRASWYGDVDTSTIFSFFIFSELFTCIYIIFIYKNSAVL